MVSGRIKNTHPWIEPFNLHLPEKRDMWRESRRDTALSPASSHAPPRRPPRPSTHSLTPHLLHPPPFYPTCITPHIPIDKVDQKEVSSFFLYSSKIKTQKHAVKSHHKASNTRLPPTPHPALGSTRLSGCYVPSSLAPHRAPPLITLARGQNRQRLPGGRIRTTVPLLTPVREEEKHVLRSHPSVVPCIIKVPVLTSHNVNV